MARDTSKLVIIPGELHSAATGNIVSASQEIFDYDSNNYQSRVNKQIYNLSLKNDASTYTIETAIAAVPESYHVGGLILTFRSEYGYNLYQLESKTWSTDVNKWNHIYENSENPEFVEVHLDSSNHVLYGVQRDGNFYFGGGVPSQVKSEIDGLDSSVSESVDEINEKLKALASGAKVTISATPTVIYKATNQTINLTGRMENGTPTSMKLIAAGHPDITGTTNPITAAITENTTANSLTYRVEGVTLGMTFNGNTSISARYPIYYAFGDEDNLENIAVDGNRYAATTSAAHTYERTSTEDELQHYFILIPNDITAPGVDKFTMGGAPFVVTKTIAEIRSISYNVYKSGNAYAKGTKLTVQITG